ncbi:DotI/IcmL family type IV secretion protein [Azohydromonas australica]|uniref:DotI/IcmL family type IV secretion protein n=1 Tax=Azohydromonas australica TaxID=364039 RepID=UPI00041DB600|nr:DotI/IcmL family type IV secretion protein [Azohydromonas australica]
MAALQDASHLPFAVRADDVAPTTPVTQDQRAGAAAPVSGNATGREAASPSGQAACASTLSFEQDLANALGQLHRTEDVVKPAVQAELGRRLLQWLARSAVKLNFILAGGLAASVFLNVILAFAALNPVREYFASDNGRLLQLVPLSRPYTKAPTVIQFAKDTLNESFTLDFTNYQAQLESVRLRYTREGYASFLQSLKASNILDLVKARRMNLSSSVGTGVLVKEGVENGIYVWYVEAPLELRLAGQTSEMPAQRFRATVRVTRVPTLDNILGISVGQLVTQPR